MTVTYDPATDVGYARLLIPDQPNQTLDPSSVIFTDEEIEAFIAREGGVKRAAAAAKLAIATSEALVSKVIRTQDLQVDGAKLATELRAQAQQLRVEADEDEDRESVGFFDIVDYQPHPPRLPRGPELTEPGQQP